MYRYQQFLLNKDTHTIWLCCQIPCLILYAKWDESGSWKKVSFLKQWRSGFKLACLAGAQKRKRVVTSANSEAAPRSLFWAAKGLNELRRVRFELIGKKTVFFFFLRGQTWRVPKSRNTSGDPEQRFRRCLGHGAGYTGLGLRSSVAHHCWSKLSWSASLRTLNQVGTSS